MDASAIVAVVAAGISLAALGASIFQARSARAQVDESRAQTALQRQMHQDATQPYVWADVRPDDGHGQLVKVVVHNAGPTVATSIRIAFDPPLPDGIPHRPGSTFTALDSGISALAPGRSMSWNLGVGHELLASEVARAYQVTVDAMGPFGPVPQLRYTIDLREWSKTAGQPPGTLHEVRNAIADVAKELKQAR
jgi:hypothetical protein